MPKVRCGGCKSYVNHENIYRKSGVMSVCSPQCLTQVRTSRRQVKLQTPKLRDRGDITTAMRKEVLLRDRNSCRYCGTNRDLQVHHIHYRSSGGPGENWNLLTLCGVHHQLVHSDKKVFLPLCLGVVWMSYMGPHRQITIPQLKRWVENESRVR